jgi:hypothetical protein
VCVTFWEDGSKWLRTTIELFYFNFYGSVHRNNILVYNSNKMHKSQSLFNLTTALHVSGVTVTHLQDHKTTVSTASGNRYTVIDRVNLSVNLTLFITV